MFLGCLCNRPLQENKSYLGSHRNLPLNLPATACITRADALFKVLCEAIPRPHPRILLRNKWISQDIWSLIDQHTDGRRYPSRDQLRMCHLGQRIRDNLNFNQAHQAKVSRGEIDSLLSGYPPLPGEAWMHLHVWYNDARNHVTPLTLVVLEADTQYNTYLYRWVPHTGEPIPVLVDTVDVADIVPSEEEIE